jgi:hypothetical protein
LRAGNFGVLRAEFWILLEGAKFCCAAQKFLQDFGIHKRPKNPAFKIGLNEKLGTMDCSNLASILLQLLLFWVGTYV